MNFDAAVMDTEFSVFSDLIFSAGNIDNNRIQGWFRFGDAGRLNGFIALVISGAATRR